MATVLRCAERDGTTRRHVIPDPPDDPKEDPAVRAVAEAFVRILSRKTGRSYRIVYGPPRNQRIA